MIDLQVQTNIENEFNIFTDGSALDNSQNSYAGYAVYMPKLNKLFSKSIIGTNNQAELEAIRFSLWYILKQFKLLENPDTEKSKFLRSSKLQSRFKLHKNIKKLILNNTIFIYSDSKYSIQMLTTNAKAKKNEDKINSCKELLEELNSYDITVKFIHVRAHTKQTDYISKCNDIVDKAAREKATIIKNMSKMA